MTANAMAGRQGAAAPPRSRPQPRRLPLQQDVGEAHQLGARRPAPRVLQGGSHSGAVTQSGRRLQLIADPGSPVHCCVPRMTQLVNVGLQ